MRLALGPLCFSACVGFEKVASHSERMATTYTGRVTTEIPSLRTNRNNYGIILSSSWNPPGSSTSKNP